jgi:hypothetical protein
MIQSPLTFVSESMPNLRRAAVQPKEKLRKLADEDLMQLVAANRADAFEVVLERNADAAFSLAYRMCGKRSIAEDVTQESFWRCGAAAVATTTHVGAYARGP